MHVGGFSWFRLVYSTCFFNSIASIFICHISLTQAVGAADKVFELIRRQPKIEEPSGVTATALQADTRQECSLATTSNLAQYGIKPMNIVHHRHRGLCPPSGTCMGQINLNDVEMFYPARPQRKILHGLTLEAPPGKVVALVGPSGGGKSSIVSLVQHLYDPSAGQITIDGKRVQDLSYEFLSRNISIVSQEPTLFARSIHRNIIYGLEGTPHEPTEEEVKKAAMLANAHAFIENLPQRYETDVGGELNQAGPILQCWFLSLLRSFIFSFIMFASLYLQILHRARSAALWRPETTCGYCKSFGPTSSYSFA